MHTDLKKTLAAVGRCLPAEGEPTWEQLRQMYDLTLRLMSQELSVIYDREAFGRPAGQEQQTFARRQSAGVNNGSAVILTIAEPLPATKKLTEAVEEHWKAMLHAAIAEAARQGRLPYFEKAFVEMEIVIPRGSGNAGLWDTSNRALQVILNNLKGVFLRMTTWNIWPFLWLGGGVKKVLRSSVFRSWTNHSRLEASDDCCFLGKTMSFEKCHGEENGMLGMER